MNQLEIIPTALLAAFKSELAFNSTKLLKAKSKETIPFDYFTFYTSVSSVYSSKIEGENIEADSYLKHKFLNVQFKADYTKKADDLFEAYAFSEKKKLKKKNVLQAHALLSQNLLAKAHRGCLRVNPMFVLNENDRIEYVACDPRRVETEWNTLFRDIKRLKKANLSTEECFYFAAFIHLVFLKIHPLEERNGRTARLIEKWFLMEKLGAAAVAIELEKNYYTHKPAYYQNIRKIGLEYETLDYTKALPFLLMTITSLPKHSS